MPVNSLLGRCSVDAQKTGEEDCLGCYEVEGKSKISLLEEGWDHLVILDACRYDSFEKIYDEYLSGKLRLALSCASDTREWMKKTFRKRHDDIVYISANPHINSKGVDVANIGFDPRACFHRIVDVWDLGWDEKAGTTPPEKVNEAAIVAKSTYPDKRLIIHYFQPHAPYLCLTDKLSVSVLPSNDLGASVSFLRNKIIRQAWLTLAGHETLLKRMVWRVRGVLSEGTPLRPIDVELRKVGRGGLLRAYENNLRRALKCAVQLLKNLPGKTVITADHGELLGEKNEWGHYPHHHVPPLIEVPYLETAM